MIGAHNSAKVRSCGWSLQRGCALKVAARGLIEAHGKIKIREPRQSLREVVNGVVFHRTRAMSAIALYLEPKVNIVLFTGLHAQEQALAFFSFKVTGIGVDAVFGVDPVAMIFGEPLHTIGLPAFFIGGESNDQVALWDPAFFFQADEIRDQDGIALLDVRRAATIKEAIHFIELEWVHGPVLAQGFHHIKVSKKKDGLPLTASVQANDEVLLVGQRPIDMDIFS